MTALPDPVHGWVARPPGVGRAGRDRRHRFPARTRRITAAFTDDEYALLVVAARRVGLTPTGFCAEAAIAIATAPAADVAPSTGRRVMVGADPGEEALAALQAELGALRTAVVRVGTNLNQAVAALNATGDPPPWLRHVLDACGRALTAVDEAASRVHRRLA
jgi:hypothetical protein